MEFPNLKHFEVSHPGPYERQMGEVIARLVRLFQGLVPDTESNARVLELTIMPDRWLAAHAFFDIVRSRMLEAMDANDPAKHNQYQLRGVLSSSLIQRN